MAQREITLIYPYYENPVMLGKQLDHLSRLPEEQKASIHLIVVDDGSSGAPLNRLDLERMEEVGLARVALYRILVDVRWNWLAARNLGADQAQTDWILLTDIDHMVPPKTWRRILDGDLSAKDVYRFSRVDAPEGTPYKPHPNSWLLTRKMFSRIGGYDERFSGFYGTDGEFRDRVNKTCRELVMLQQALVRVPREVVPDASTTNYGRKEPQDREGVGRIRKLIAKDPKPHRLTFPWEQIL